jgi:hypothetical protein
MSDHIPPLDFPAIDDTMNLNWLPPTGDDFEFPVQPGSANQYIDLSLLDQPSAIAETLSALPPLGGLDP